MVRLRMVRFVLGVALVLVVSGVASAANKEHQQMMADIRMLQEQTALLRAQLSALTEVLRSVGTKLDDQAAASRRAFADQKLLVDTISGDLRVVREKVDDNNVRISSLSQELEAVRLALPQSGSGGAGNGRARRPESGRRAARVGSGAHGRGRAWRVASAAVRPGLGRLRRLAVQPGDLRVRELHPEPTGAPSRPATRSTSSARATTSRACTRRRRSPTTAGSPTTRTASGSPTCTSSAGWR